MIHHQKKPGGSKRQIRTTSLLIEEAITDGARRAKACAGLELSERIFRKWTRDGQVHADQRPLVPRTDPRNKLSAAERAVVLDVCNSTEFASLPPSQIVPGLADQGRYLASESSFYRILRADGQQHHRISCSRPRVSNDNPFSEALLRTCKYRPGWPTKGFAAKAQAQYWVKSFTSWYNGEHLHSAIRFVTPDARHAGCESATLANRATLYANARAQNPKRWSGKTRNWQPAGPVWLNPETETSADEIRGAA